MSKKKKLGLCVRTCFHPSGATLAPNRAALSHHPARLRWPNREGRVCDPARRVHRRHGSADLACGTALECVPQGYNINVSQTANKTKVEETHAKLNSAAFCKASSATGAQSFRSNRRCKSTRLAADRVSNKEANSAGFGLATALRTMTSQTRALNAASSTRSCTLADCDTAARRPPSSAQANASLWSVSHTMEHSFVGSVLVTTSS